MITIICETKEELNNIKKIIAEQENKCFQFPGAECPRDYDEVLSCNQCRKKYLKVIKVEEK